MRRSPIYRLFFFFNDTATTEIYTLSLHDALPIYVGAIVFSYANGSAYEVEFVAANGETVAVVTLTPADVRPLEGREIRSEEHTSELQSQSNLVCRLLLEKKSEECVHRPGHHGYDF